MEFQLLASDNPITNPANLLGLAGIGALIAMIAGFWDKFKAIMWRICSILIQRVEIPSESAHDALIAHLISKYKRWKAYDRMFGASYEHYRDGRYGLVAYEQYGNRSMIFFKGWTPFLFNNAVESKAKTGKENNNSDATKVYSTITFIRGTINVDEILSDACRVKNNLSWSVTNTQEKSRNRFVIHYFPKREDSSDDNRDHSTGLAWYQQGMYRLLELKPDELGKAPLTRGSALENLIFPQRVKDLIKEIELWRNHREWYRDKSIPWKRGWLLYGPPGTGKTALARAFAEDLNMPIYVFNLAEMTNHQLIEAWRSMQVNVPCIALIEDIDNVFHGRKNVANAGGFMSMMYGQGGNKGDNNNDNNKDSMPRFNTPLTFDCLLNCLDGVERNDGIFTIISTNDIAKVDPALGQPRKLPDGTMEFISTRPGRIDKAVELTYMENADKKRMAKRILVDYPEIYEEMLGFVEKFPDLQETPAQFQERCAQVALKRFWEEKEAAINGKKAELQKAENPVSLEHHEGSPFKKERNLEPSGNGVTVG